MPCVTDTMIRDVQTIAPRKPLRNAALIMRTPDIGALPVCAMVGIVAPGDVAQRQTVEIDTMVRGISRHAAEDPI
jgi:CBS domain-containing protein